MSPCPAGSQHRTDTRTCQRLGRGSPVARSSGPRLGDSPATRRLRASPPASLARRPRRRGESKILGEAMAAVGAASRRSASVGATLPEEQEAAVGGAGGEPWGTVGGASWEEERRLWAGLAGRSGLGEGSGGCGRGVCGGRTPWAGRPGRSWRQLWAGLAGCPRMNRRQLREGLVFRRHRRGVLGGRGSGGGAGGGEEGGRGSGCGRGLRTS